MKPNLLEFVFNFILPLITYDKHDDEILPHYYTLSIITYTFVIQTCVTPSNVLLVHLPMLTTLKMKGLPEGI